MKDKLESFLRVNAATGCNEFQGALDSSGYGNIRIGDRVVGAHRVAYEVYKGTIGKGLQVLHKCNNPKCCNPEHLYLGTHADNMKYKAKCGHVNTVGIHNPNAVLTEDQVRRIRELCKTSSDQTVAAFYNIHLKTVGKIRRRLLWSHLQEK